MFKTLMTIVLLGFTTSAFASVPTDPSIPQANNVTCPDGFFTPDDLQAKLVADPELKVIGNLPIDAVVTMVDGTVVNQAALDTAGFPAGTLGGWIVLKKDFKDQGETITFDVPFTVSGCVSASGFPVKEESDITASN